MIKTIAKNSIQENRVWSRLPEFDEKWIKTIRGSADFLGFNYYSSRLIEATDEPEGKNPSYYHDQMLKRSVDPSWKRAKSEWLYSVPSGIRDALR